MRISSRIVAAGAMLLMLAGCATTTRARPADETGPSIAAFVHTKLSGLPGVVTVDASQTSKTPDVPGACAAIEPSPAASSSPDAATSACWDASRWRISVSLVMSETATVDEAAAAAALEQKLSTRFAVPGADLWDAEIGLGRTIGGPDTDTTPHSAATVIVFPAAQDPVETVRRAMAVLALPGVMSVGLGVATPSVTADTIDHLGAVYDVVQKLPEFKNGGDYWADDGRVRIADVPDHLTDAAVHAILDAASAYPTAEFWLQTPRDQNHWPALYVNHLAPGEDAALAARLSAPELAAANVAGAPLPYIISQTTGGASLNGTFGGG